MPRLIIREMGRERVVEVDLDKITIGRSKANTIAISDSKASRAHCAIQQTDKGWFVIDLGSSNGTLLNGQPVTKDLLSLGDVIMIGSSEIHFERVVEDHVVPKPADESAYMAQVAEVKEKSVSPGKMDSIHADAGGARYLIKMVEGIKPGSTYPLGGQALTIGRKNSNTIPIEDERVSGNHATISREGSVWVLTDLGSTNGTVMNGRKINREILDHGWFFSIGSTTFQFIDIQAPEAPAQQPVVKPGLISEPGGLPSDADFERIDVQKALRTKKSNPVLTFLYAIAAIFLIISVAYFAFQVFRQIIGRSSFVAKPGNLAVNWSFEEALRIDGKLEGWSVPSSGWFVDINAAKTGKQALKLDCSVNDNPDDILAIDMSPISVTPDRQYQVRVQVKINDARKAGVRVTWSDPLNPYFVQESYSDLLSAEGSSWKLIRWDFIPPEKATKMQLSLCVFGNVGEVWFDDIELYETDSEPGDIDMRRVALGNELDIKVDYRGTWNLAKLGAITLWDAQLFLTGKDGKTDLFSRQSTSNIQKRASVSGGSMLYLGHIYEPYSASWVPLTHEIFTRDNTLSVRYKISGDFTSGGEYGIMLTARPDMINSTSPVEVSTEAGVQLFKGDFELENASEMVWGSGENIIAFGFPEPIDISVASTKEGVKIVLSKKFETSKDVGFAVDFSELSQRQQQKIASQLAGIVKLREEGRLQEAINMAQYALRELVAQSDAKDRLQKLVKEMEQEGEVLAKEVQYIYEDFKKSRHPELMKNLEVLIERISVAFPSSERERDAKELLVFARAELQKESNNQLENKAKEMLLKGDSYRQLGMLGLAAVHYEYVRDNFTGTEFEKDAKAKLEQIENQIKHEGKW